MTYRFVAEALAELIAAGRYYNRQVPGLGDAFMTKLKRASGPFWRRLQSGG